jgi:hypothetical protein
MDQGLPTKGKKSVQEDNFIDFAKKHHRRAQLFQNQNKTYRIHQQAMYTGIQDPCINMEGSHRQQMDTSIWHLRVLFDKLVLQHS